MGLLDGFVLLLVAHDGWVQSICRTVVWTNHLAWKLTEPLYTKETVGHSSTVSLRQGFSKFRQLGTLCVCVCGGGTKKKKFPHPLFCFIHRPHFETHGSKKGNAFAVRYKVFSVLSAPGVQSHYSIIC